MPSATLLIMRHADAEPGRPGAPDEARQLTEGGRIRAASRAAAIAEHDVDLVLCSSALRTRQTLAQLQLERAEVRIDRAVYEASATDALALLSGLPDGAGTVLYLGHMPTVELLVRALVTSPPMDLRFPPATVAVVDIDRPWDRLAPGAGSLRQLLT